MASNNVVNSILSGATGTGNFVGSVSPVITSPTLGVATATSIQFSPTSNEFVGTTTANNANTGIVGEFMSSVIPVSGAISIANVTYTPLTSITLGAGDWQIWGNLYYLASGGAPMNVNGTLSTSSSGATGSVGQTIGGTAAGNIGLSIPTSRASFSSTLTIYLLGIASFNSLVVTLTFCGGIYARRVR
jgi:hypothetical protein